MAEFRSLSIFLCSQVDEIPLGLSLRAGYLRSLGQQQDRYPLGKAWLHRDYRNKLTGCM